MAANSNPIFTLVTHVGQCTITTANTNRDGTGTLVSGFTAGANGSLIDAIHIHATSSTVAGIVTIFLVQSTTYTLIAEVPVTAVTPSATVVAYSDDWSPPFGALEMPAGAQLYFGTTISQNLVVTVRGGDF